MKTKDEIDRQITGLKQMKESLPRYNLFGGNNWSPIEAQISVLNGTATPDKFYEDESAEEFEDGDNDIYHEAVAAKEWLEGGREEDLFEIL